MNLSPNRDRWMVPGVCLFLAALVWVVFGQTVQYGFVNFDDDVYVYKNPNVTGGLNWEDISWAFTHVHSSNWHPLTWLSHMLDCQYYGLKAGRHHLTNVLLHTATTIALFLVLRQMTGLLWRCAFVAAVFAIHPLRVESVAWIAERKDVLSGLFFMLTLAAYVQYTRSAPVLGRSNVQTAMPLEMEKAAGRKVIAAAGDGRAPHLKTRIGYYLVTLLMMALALMSKPMVVTLPVVLLLLDYWPLKRFGDVGGGGVPWRLFVEKIPMVALSAAVCLITIFAQKDAMSAPPLSLRLGNAMVSCIVYLEQMFWPVKLAVLYPFPDTGLPIFKIVVAVGLLLVVSIVAVAARHRLPWLLFGWLWYLVMLAPVIGILQVGSQAHADRYTYLPQIGLYLAVVWLVADLGARWQSRRLVFGGVAAGILCALVLCARAQAGYWRDSESLWTHTLACTTRNAIADINYGNALLEHGKIDDALVQYKTALEIKPDDADANVSLAYALIQKGKGADAHGYLVKALQIKPNCAEAHNDLGIILSERGDTGEAIVHFEEALRAKPNYADACYNYANALFKRGKMDEAIARYQQTLHLKPDYAEAGYNLGNAFFQQGKLDDAISAYQTALQIKPDYLNAAYNLAMTLQQKGKTDEAIVQFERVLKINPGSAEACFNLGNALIQKGKASEGISVLERAVKVRPDYIDALNNLAFELAAANDVSLRNGERAIELAQHANQLADGKDLDILDTLACAYAAAGRFDDAVQVIQKAIGLAQASQPNMVNQFKAELNSYSAHIRFHELGK